MGPRSLFRMAEKVAIKHVDGIHDLGELPFHACKGILDKIKDAKQLRRIQESNQILAEDTAYIWYRLIKQDFKIISQRLKWTVDNPADAVQLYYRYEREETESLQRSMDQLKQSINKIEKDKRANTTSLIPIGSAPRMPISTGQFAGRWSSSGSWGGPSKYAGKTQGQIGLMKTMQRVRTARNINSVAHRSVVGAPTGVGQIKQAPRSMVDEYERKNRVAKQQAAPIRAPRRLDPNKIQKTIEPALLSREDRLRRIKEGKSTATPEVAPHAPVSSCTAGSSIVPPAPTMRPPLKRSGILKATPTAAPAGGKVTRVQVGSMATDEPKSRAQILEENKQRAMERRAAALSGAAGSPNPIVGDHLHQQPIQMRHTPFHKRRALESSLLSPLKRRRMS